MSEFAGQRALGVRRLRLVPMQPWGWPGWCDPRAVRGFCRSAVPRFDFFAPISAFGVSNTLTGHNYPVAARVYLLGGR